MQGRAYWGRDPHVIDWPQHKDICKKVGRARYELEAEEAEEATLDAYAASLSTILPGGSNVDSLFKLAMLGFEVDTRLSVRNVLGNVLRMTERHKSPMLAMADLVPANFLCLGLDQEAYDFMKWWIVTPDTLMSPPRQPYTAVKGEDIFEPVTVFIGECPSLGFMAHLTLLKLRLLMDLQTLQRSRNEVPGHLPQELLDQIRKTMVSSAITKTLIERDNHTPNIESLILEVKTLYDVVETQNKHFWPAVPNPADHLTAEAEGGYYGNEGEIRMALRNTYKAWAETPGVIDTTEILSQT
jgi:hypothetical protein